MSSNCFSGTESKEMYSSIRKALSFDISNVLENEMQLTGIITNIEVVLDSVPEYSSIGIDWGSVSLTKVIKQSKITTSKKSDKTKLFLKNTNTSINTPIQIAQQIAVANNLIIGDSFSDVNAKQLNFFPENNIFDGSFSPSPDQSVSDVLNSIAKMSMTAIYQDASGVIQSKFLAEEPDSYSIDFDSSLIKKGSLTFSMPNNGYMYSDYDFSVVKNSGSESCLISIDTDGIETFPNDSDYDLGSVIFDFAGGYLITTMNIDWTSAALDLRIRNYNNFLFSFFIIGTTWKYSSDINGVTNLFTLRLDSSSLDISCPIDSKGIRLGFKILDWMEV
jgi:hypothetical protein